MRQPLVLALFLFATGAAAQAPYLVKDLGNASSTLAVSSTPNAFLSSGGKLFFTATTETNGLEPWVHDANGTRLLRDINAGTLGSNVLRFLEVTPGVVIFGADDGVNGSQLWRSDGTDAGTTLVKVVNATTATITPAFAHGGKAFFLADDGVHGREPWVTDGTAAGTQLLAETLPGTSGTSSWQLFRFGNTTYFFASGGIWTTDGTPAGTALSIPLSAYKLGVAVTPGAFYFFGYDSVHGYEPWKSDGTVGGTAMIKEIRGGLTTYSSSIVATASGAVFYADDGGSGGGRLWTTDGTAANTFPLQAIPASGTANYVGGLAPLSSGRVIVFGGSNVWRTDGTEAGTYLSFTMNGPSFNFIEAFGKIYFSSYLGGSTLTLFQFDGSQGATPASVRSDVRVLNVTATGGKLWFAGTDAANGSELWVSDDGTTNGTHLVANVAPDPARSSKPVNLTPAGAYLYFHPESPKELWRTDGTSGGTFEFTDVDNNLISPPPFGDVTPFGGHVYHKRGHSEFYRVDGVTGASTKIGNYEFDRITADEARMYLWSYSWANVMSSDGTAAGTIKLYDPSEPDHLQMYSESITVVTDGGYGWIRCSHGLFRTEGTVATTQRVASVPEGGYLTGELAAAGGLLYSVLYTSAQGSELWRSDGSGGSFVVKDAYPGPPGSGPSSLTPAGRLLFYTAYDPEHGSELWRSDGTAAGTFLVKDIRPGTASSALYSLTAIGEAVYFAANDGTSGVELWKSDGTEAGTVLVRDIVPGPFSSRPAWLAAAGGKIWFSANDGLHGYELWSSDGTEAGTVLAGDIIPGSSSSSPDQMTPAESLLYFTATTDAEGRELWALPLTAGYLSVTGARTAEGNSGTHALRFTIRRHGASSGAASVAYATAPGTASAGTDYTPAAGTIDFAAGQTVKTVDVPILGDTVTETSETLFLLLSSPVGVALQDAVGAGTIDDDDAQADLTASLVQSAVESSQAQRTLKVTNLGPSIARSITVTFTESPYALSVSSPDGVTCTNTMPSQCTIPFLQPGETRTWRLVLYDKEGLVDPALPPGHTVTVQVSAALTDPVPSNNTASWMTTENGMLLLPAKLVAGSSATATFDLGENAASATDVTLASSAANVAVTPATARIEAGQRTASFTLTTSAGAARTLLTATIAAETRAALVVPVVASGQSPLLDVAIVADVNPEPEPGELFIIPVRVAARYPDGTVPGGLVTLFDENGAVLSQLVLDTAGAATFTRPHPAPGQYQYRVGYSGDARFNPLTVTLPEITAPKLSATLTLHVPVLNCSNPVAVRMLANGGSDGEPAPAGTITLWSSQTNLGTYTLSPNGVSGQSEVTATVTLASGFRQLYATYSGDAHFWTASASKYVSVGCAAMNLVATATSTTSVALTWTQPGATATTYDVYRALSIEGPYEWITRTYGFNATDTTAQPGRVYVYYVSAFGASGTPSYTSAVDIASTFAYTDSPLVSGMRVKSGHLSELRAMVSALRGAAALPALTFSGSVARGSVIKAVHVAELRSSIDASRARIGLPAINWTQPNAVKGARIRAATLQEMRGTAN